MSLPWDCRHRGVAGVELPREGCSGAGRAPGPWGTPGAGVTHHSLRVLMPPWHRVFVQAQLLPVDAHSVLMPRTQAITSSSVRDNCSLAWDMLWQCWHRWPPAATWGRWGKGRGHLSAQVSLMPSLRCGQHLLSPSARFESLLPQHCSPAPLKDLLWGGGNLGQHQGPPKAGRKGRWAGQVPQDVTLSLPGLD